MTEKYTNVFISSKNRDINETPYNYTCKFPDDVIKCDNNQGIKINIISFDMINQMYNVNINNNRYNIITTDLNDENETIITYSIPYGNYSVKDIMDYFNNNNTKIRISYNTITNKYLFTSLDADLKIYLKIINSATFFGFDNDDTILINNSISANTLNVVYNNKIIVRATNLNFEISSLENINTHNINNNFEISNILLWISKTDVIPFQTTRYDNYDGGDSYSYSLYDKSINEINFTISNEYDELITDASDWCMSVRFTIYNRRDDEEVKLLTIISTYLREIWVLLNIFYSYIIYK